MWKRNSQSHSTDLIHLDFHGNILFTTHIGILRDNFTLKIRLKFLKRYWKRVNCVFQSDIWPPVLESLGLLRWFNSLKKQKNVCLPIQETWVRSLGWEGYPGGGNGNPLQYSCLGNPMDRGAWRATVHGVAKESDMT